MNNIVLKIHSFFASLKLAMLLLVLILSSCLLGVTVFRADNYGSVIFRSIWFNCLLVLLVINVACCFFSRIWGRRVTLISFGMILFHLSFVSMFLGIAYNSLFYFRGNLRLAEGESIANGDPKSYDAYEKGRFFKFTRLSGETSLLKMHTGYRVGKEDKRAAYEVEVGERNNVTKDFIYITHKLTHNGVEYFNDKEGYSLLVTLYDTLGKELYGAYLPLQSIPQNNNSYIYTTGFKNKDIVREEAIFYPQPPNKPLVGMQVRYLPSPLVERGGDVQFKTIALDENGKPETKIPYIEGKVPVGKKFHTGEYTLSAMEVRYWVGILVRYEPGKPIVLISLCVGLVGMIITTLARMFKKGANRVVQS